MIQRDLPTAAFREEHLRAVPAAFARFENAELASRLGEPGSTPGGRFLTII